MYGLGYWFWKYYFIVYIKMMLWNIYCIIIELNIDRRLFFVWMYIIYMGMGGGGGYDIDILIYS